MSDDWIRQIPGGENFAKAEPLRAGLSGDRKYVIESVDGRRLLLRVSDISEYAGKCSERTEFFNPAGGINTNMRRTTLVL